ncbi:MAG: sugar ABC transporter substrate-binding protein [Reyranella sp.]|uniref:ABC transporter substrate-binding protein n=1 Tax=Reyranella sp. TaxID=1929291 RepID=UPI001AC17E15|nr:sugar ABC transporter substrate-binding protein [Reyranella sp.]MBN9086513.1 sugar ABC transporter substrate-binding protein [Reyranella sp.]
MHSRRQWLAGLPAAALLTPFLTLGAGFRAAAQEDALAYYKQAKIDWQQAKGQSLTIGLNKHPFTESLLPLIPEFRQLTGINIEYLILPEAEYFTKLVADLSQQRGEFSVIMTGPMRNWQYVPPNWILPLDDFLKNPKLTDAAWYKLDDFYPALTAANRWNGKDGSGVGEGPLYSIPVLEESYILAYRKDIFDQHDIKVPTTLEEMAEAARQVKKNAGIPGITARGTPSLASMGTGFISGLKSYTDGQWRELDDKLVANLHDPRSVKYTELWIDMVRESGPPNWANTQWYDAMEAFTAGQAGMIADADFFAASYEDPKKSKVAGKVGYALLPAGPGGKTYSGLWTWALGISRATRNKDAAWLFVQWATAQRTLLNATVGYRNYNPSRQSVTNDPRVQEIMAGWGGGSYLKTVAKNLETARVAWVPQSERQRLGDIWARALHEVYFKRLSAADALKKASGEVDKVLKEAGIK